MNSYYKPGGYNTASPYLIVNGAVQTIDFLVKAFGAVEIRRFKGDGEQIMHVEVRIEDSFLMLADGDEGWPTAPSNVHIYAPDVDATYKLALEADASSAQEPTKKEDADKRAGVKDSGGTTWRIATKVE